MSHMAVPTHRYGDIAAIRLSTRSALTIPLPDIPEPPRPQYDTMKAYERLEKAGTIADLESLQRNVRPLFAYPLKDFQTPRKKKIETRRREFRREEEEDVVPLMSSSLVETSDLLDSIFSSPLGGEQYFSSSPRTSVDFSSSLPYPYPEEQRGWRSNPLLRISGRKHRESSSPYATLPANSDPIYSNQQTWSSSPPLRIFKRRNLESSSPTRPANSDLPYHPTPQTRSSSPPYHIPARHLSNSPSLQYLPSSPPISSPAPTPSHPRLSTPTSLSRRASKRIVSSPYTTILEDDSPAPATDSTRAIVDSPVMRYTTILEDVSEDSAFKRLSRRSRLSLRVERAVGWVLGR